MPNLYSIFCCIIILLEVMLNHIVTQHECSLFIASILLWMNKIMFMWAGLNELRFELSMSPVVENIASTGMLVAGMLDALLLMRLNWDIGHNKFSKTTMHSALLHQ
jgi:hypothetical protein